mgnify:CR=1 FL=1
MKEVYKGHRVTCSDHGWSTLSSCADFVGTFEECRSECTERPNVSQNSNMRKASGVKGDVGRTMAIWAYVGVFAGTLALYKYLDLFDEDKKKLLIGYGIVFAGLAAGSAIGSYRVSQK